MFAIIETGGKQYRVEVGSLVTVEKLDAAVGEKVTFSAVISGEGAELAYAPSAAQVVAEVVYVGKGDKIIVYKYKAKKNVRKKQGHRQPFTQLKVVSIG